MPAARRAAPGEARGAPGKQVPAPPPRGVRGPPGSGAGPGAVCGGAVARGKFAGGCGSRSVRGRQRVRTAGMEEGPGGKGIVSWVLAGG